MRHDAQTLAAHFSRYAQLRSRRLVNKPISSVRCRCRLGGCYAASHRTHRTRRTRRPLRHRTRSTRRTRRPLRGRCGTRADSGGLVKEVVPQVGTRVWRLALCKCDALISPIYQAACMWPGGGIMLEEAQRPQLRSSGPEHTHTRHTHTHARDTQKS